MGAEDRSQRILRLSELTHSQGTASPRPRTQHRTNSQRSNARKSSRATQSAALSSPPSKGMTISRSPEKRAVAEDRAFGAKLVVQSALSQDAHDAEKMKVRLDRDREAARRASEMGKRSR